MKRIVIIVLTAAILLINGYSIWAAGQTEKNILPENLVVVKAPEQTESMENEYFAGEEYVAVLPEGCNIAPEGKATSSGFEGTFTERKAIDGKTDGASYWEGSADSYPNDLTVTFDSERNIHAIRVALCPDAIWGKRTQTFSVKITDGSGMERELFAENSYEFSPNRGNEVILEFEECGITSVTLHFTGNTGASGGQVAEFEIYE